MPGLSVCILAYKDLRLNTRVVRQAGALAGAGHSVTVVSFAAPDPALAAAVVGGTFLETGVPLAPALIGAPLPSAVKGTLATAIGTSRCQRFGRTARRLLEGRRFDVVQAHYDKALIAADAVRRACGGKLVYDAVENPFDDALLPAGATMRALRRAEVKREIAIALHADGWVTVNDGLADHAVATFGVERPLVVRNCRDAVPRGNDGRLRADLGLGPEDRLLLHLNTIRPGEGVDVAVEALAQLPGTVHLAALGPEGAKGYTAALRARAEALGVSDRFHLPPLQPPHALLSYAAGADVGVIARQADSENLRLSLPNRVFEMIAARLPIVAGGLPEIARLVRDWGIGEVFDERVPSSVAAAAQSVLAPERRPVLAQAVDAAAEALTWEREAKRYVAFIEDLARRQ